MNRVAGVIAIHFRDKSIWVPGPFILGSAFVINFVIAFLLGGDKHIITGGLATVYIYMLIAGAAIVKDTFPFALGFSVRRTDYFLGTAAVAVAVSAIWALLIQSLSLIESQMTNNWGVDLHFFHLPYLSEGPIIAELWTYFAIMLFVYMLGFVLASLHQRAGRLGLYTFFGVAGLLATVGIFVATYRNLWGGIFRWLTEQSAAGLALWLIPVILSCTLGSYVLLRKASA